MRIYHSQDEALRRHIARDDTNIGPSSAIQRRQEARSATDPAHTLVPAQPPDVDIHHLDRLFPVLDGTHHYTPTGHPLDYNTATFFANANITYQYPTVVLPHSALISYTECVPGGFEIGFARSEAFNYVQKAWTILPHRALTLVSSSLECDSAGPGSHSYWNVTDLSFNPTTMSVTAKADEVELRHAYQKVSEPAMCFPPSEIIYSSFLCPPQVKLQWGSTNPSNETNGGEGAMFSGAPGKQFVSESKTAVRKREILKREEDERLETFALKRRATPVSAQLVPYYAKGMFQYDEDVSAKHAANTLPLCCSRCCTYAGR